MSGLSASERESLSDALDPILAQYVGPPIPHEAIAIVLDMAQSALTPAVEQIATTHTAAAVAGFKAEAVAAIEEMTPELEPFIPVVIGERSGLMLAARIVANLTPSDP